MTTRRENILKVMECFKRKPSCIKISFSNLAELIVGSRYVSNIKFSYQLFISDPSKWRPKCFFARSDVLVFEDLNLLGYSQLKHRTEFQTAHIQCALSTLAKMHAASITYDLSIHPSSIGVAFEDVLFETSIGLNNTWFLVGLEV